MNNVQHNTERRKEQVAERASTSSASLNGIDFVELYSDGCLTGESPPCQFNLLALVFVNELTPPHLSLQAEQLSITGGERVPEVEVHWVEPWQTLKTLHEELPTDVNSTRSAIEGHFSDARDNLGTGDQDRIHQRWQKNVDSLLFRHVLASSWGNVESFVRAEHGAQPQRTDDEVNRVLLVGTDGETDFSSYTLSLHRPKAPDTVPDQIDPLLSSVSVNFKINCDRALDCDPPEDEVPESHSSPRIDYLAKDYDSFRQLMLERLSTIMPEWRDRTPGDLGVMLVELLAYAADQLSYYQDAVATESYLKTARQRISVRRHARLLDYRVHEGTNARTWISLNVNGSDHMLIPQFDPQPEIGPERLTFFTSMAGVPATIEPEQVENVLREHDPEVFELMEPTYVDAAHNRIQIHDWGDPEFKLPEGTTRATLRDPDASGTRPLHLMPGDVVIFEQIQHPDMAEGVEDPSRRHAVRLTDVTPAATEGPDAGPTRTRSGTKEDPVEDVPIVEIEWDEADALPFDLHVSAIDDGRQKSDLAVARGNVALVDHGRTIRGEKLPDVNDRPYRPTLEESPITHAAPVPSDPTTPASKTLRPDPDTAEPEITVHEFGNSIYNWVPEPDLLNSGPMARNFVVEIENDRTVQLRFGDGEHGKRPTGHRKMTATYRIGNGTDGHVAADAIRHVTTASSMSLEITGVRNPLPATGGTKPEPLRDVQRLAPHAYKKQLRAVTDEDYAEWAETHPDVQRALAFRRWTGSWYTLFIVADRYGGQPVDQPFENRLRNFLEQYRLAGDDVEIIEPEYVPLEIKMRICVAPGFDPNRVRRRLLRVFGDGEGPEGKGFFHPDRLTFGDAIYKSELIAEAMDVDGVQEASFKSKNEPTKFQRLFHPSETDQTKTDAPMDEGVIPIGNREIAQLENNPNYPERGTFELIMK